VFNAQSHRKLRSCLWSTATGLVEPLAAVLAVLALAPYITDATLDYSLLYVGGCVTVPLSSLNFLMHDKRQFAKTGSGQTHNECTEKQLRPL
jgi:zinc transporter ZupT